MYYDVIKALHILSVISWMVGLLYLPRLFVYHADAEVGTVRAETFKVMERRLLKAIMTPAMIASFIFGIWMIALNHGLVFEIWFQIKVAFFARPVHHPDRWLARTVVIFNYFLGYKSPQRLNFHSERQATDIILDRQPKITKDFSSNTSYLVGNNLCDALACFSCNSSVHPGLRNSVSSRLFHNHFPRHWGILYPQCLRKSDRR